MSVSLSVDVKCSVPYCAVGSTWYSSRGLHTVLFQDQDNISNMGYNKDKLKNTVVLQKAASKPKSAHLDCYFITMLARSIEP